MRNFVLLVGGCIVMPVFFISYAMLFDHLEEKRDTGDMADSNLLFLQIQEENRVLRGELVELHHKLEINDNEVPPSPPVPKPGRFGLLDLHALFFLFFFIFKIHFDRAACAASAFSMFFPKHFLTQCFKPT
jgi:hypothetical protein